MREISTAIPNYALYGEDDASFPRGFGHIETIAERSSLHDWEIAPHRHHHSVQVLIITQGNVSLSLDGEQSCHFAPCYVAIPAGAVHGFRFTPGTQGHVLTLSQEISDRVEGENDSLGRLLSGGGHGPLTPQQARLVNMLAAELMTLIDPWNGTDNLFRAMAEALFRSLPEAGTDAASSEDRRLAVFRHLIETHLTEHRPVSFFAASIGTTERTLARLVQRRLGCTPLEVINRRVALEARRLLRYTNASVAQISDELGFADVSYFSRFYLRVTGRRPTAERG